MNKGTVKRSLKVITKNISTPSRLVNLFKRYTMRMREDGSLPYTPATLDIEPTLKCNLKCPMCLRTYGYRTAPDMTAEQFAQIIEGCPGLMKVKLQGIGEPLLSNNFFDILNVADKKNISLHTISNGTLFNDSIISKIYDSSLLEIQISLDSVDKESFEKIRVGADFEKVISGIKKLTSHPSRKKLSISVWATIWKETAEYAPDLVRFCSDAGIDSVFITFSLGDWGNDSVREAVKEHLAVNDDSYERIHDECMRIAEKSSSVLTVFPPVYECPQLNGMCSWPLNSAFITCEGFVTPCCKAVEPEKFNFGNVFETPFKDIWNNDKYRAFRLRMASGEYPEICRALCGNR